VQVVLKVGLQTLTSKRACTLVFDTPILLGLVGCLSKLLEEVNSFHEFIVGEGRLHVRGESSLRFHVFLSVLHVLGLIISIARSII
jgi:hypothetical protein